MGQPEGSAELWINSPHGEECDTSCNRCLRDFYNLSYHGLLDWRLAIDMTRLALNSRAVVDLEARWTPYVNPWQSLCSEENSPVSIMLENLGFTRATEYAGLQA